MVTLPETLMHELRDRDVRVEVLDADTLVLRRVPVRPSAFNKPTTNLLVKRPAAGMPYMALVDENLAYLGGDETVKTAFATVAARQGWRPLGLEHPADRDLELVLRDALRVLGFETPPPAQPSAAPTGGLLARFGKPVDIGPGRPPVLGRDDEITDVIACLRRREPCMPLVVGGPGSGKSALLRGVAQRLAESSMGLIELELLEVFSVATDAARMRCVAELLDEASQARVIVAIEHADMLVGYVNWGPLLLRRALDKGLRAVGTALPESTDPFACADLARHIHVIDLPDLPRDLLIQIARNARAGREVEVHEAAAVASVKTASDLPGCFPGKALSLLDAATTFAAVSGAKVVAADDVLSAAQRVRSLEKTE